jgi:hypothetical protein
VQATTVRPRITVTADGRGVASHAGSRLLADLADAAGVSAAFSDALCGLRERRAGHDPGRVLVDLAVMLADGGETISDLATLRDQPAGGLTAEPRRIERQLARAGWVPFRRARASTGASSATG